MTKQQQHLNLISFHSLHSCRAFNSHVCVDQKYAYTYVVYTYVHIISKAGLGELLFATQQLGKQKTTIWYFRMLLSVVGSSPLYVHIHIIYFCVHVYTYVDVCHAKFWGLGRWGQMWRRKIYMHTYVFSRMCVNVFQFSHTVDLHPHYICMCTCIW